VQSSYIRAPAARHHRQTGWWIFTIEQAGNLIAIDGKNASFKQPLAKVRDRRRVASIHTNSWRRRTSVADVGNEDYRPGGIVADSSRDRRKFHLRDAAHLWCPMLAMA
jgi:hypothetical protein